MSSATRSTRILLRQSRQLRQAPRARFNSTQSASVNTTAKGGFHPGVTGAIAGATAAVVAGYGFYHYSGTKDLVDTAQKAKGFFTSSTQALKGEAPDTSEALEWLRSTAGHYAIFIPGGKAFIDSAFKDMDAIRKKHGDEVDKIVKDTYGQLQKVTEEKGLSLEAATSAWSILTEKLGKIKDLAGDAMEDVLENHPDLQKQIGDKVTTLRGLGDKFGPDAQAKIDEAWGKINEVLKNGKGISSENIEKIKSIIQQVTDGVSEFGDKALKQGLDQAKPYLDKAPQIRELIQKNSSELIKNADFKKLFDLVKDAAKSGDFKPVQKYVESVIDKTPKK